MMKKPYVFGHRGAMGYEIENTIESFEKAVNMGAGIESDIQLTKDGILVCLHDSSFKIGEKWYSIKNMTFEELKNIKFQDGRKVPTLEEVFDKFKYKKDLRYSFDIGSRKVGLKVIEMAKKYNILDKIEITDTNPKILFYLREHDKEVKLVHTVPFNIEKINEKTVDFEKLKQFGIRTLNIRAERANPENFEMIVYNGFNCYVWDVNKKIRMKRVISLKCNGQIVDAIYTNYPDRVIQLINEIIK
ncbi:MAG: glycerophosphodiester phosphodiesterase [Promethearchaeota archaeon]